MLLEDEIEDFAKLEWVIDCQSISLRQLATKKPHLLRGPGRIFQKTDGQLYFEVYVANAATGPSHIDPVGEVLPRSRYYSLSATDWRGRKWKAPQVYPGGRKWMPGRFSVVTGRLTVLRGVEKEERTNDLHLITGYVFTAGVKVPANRRTTRHTTRGTSSWAKSDSWDVATFTVGNTEVNFEHDLGRTVLRARRDGDPFPTTYPQRVLEALRFVTGALASWSMLFVAGAGRTQCTLYRVDRREVGVSPPIARNTTVSEKATEDMFRCYLNYVLRERRRHRFHILSAEWGDVLRASRSTLQTQATIWCVAVEAVLKLVVKSRRVGPVIDSKQKARVQKWRDRVVKYLQDEGCPRPTLDRFIGTTARLLEPRHIDVLKKLASLRAVDGQLEKRWSRLRNLSAHAEHEGQGTDDRLFRDNMAVVSLLYQLTFYLIGYEGWFTDYGTKNWPVKKYPIPKAE